MARVRFVHSGHPLWFPEACRSHVGEAEGTCARQVAPRACVHKPSGQVSMAGGESSANCAARDANAGR